MGGARTGLSNAQSRSRSVIGVTASAARPALHRIFQVGYGMKIAASRKKATTTFAQPSWCIAAWKVLRAYCASGRDTWDSKHVLAYECTSSPPLACHSRTKLLAYLSERGFTPI